MSSLSNKQTHEQCFGFSAPQRRTVTYRETGSCNSGQIQCIHVHTSPRCLGNLKDTEGTTASDTTERIIARHNKLG